MKQNSLFFFFWLLPLSELPAGLSQCPIRVTCDPNSSWEHLVLEFLESEKPLIARARRLNAAVFWPWLYQITPYLWPATDLVSADTFSSRLPSPHHYFLSASEAKQKTSFVSNGLQKLWGIRTEMCQLLHTLNLSLSSYLFSHSDHRKCSVIIMTRMSN